MPKAPAIRDYACQTPAEARGLSELLTDLGDPQGYERYAEKLQRRAPEKADYIRRLAQAVFGRGRRAFPETGDLPETWLRMVGTAWHAQLRQLRAPARRALNEWLAPVVTIDTSPSADSKIPVGASKFGGRPDLPPDFEWPSCPSGKLGFMGQISYSDLALSQAQIRYGLPKAGLLSIFAFDDPDQGIQPGVGEVDPDTGIYSKLKGLCQIMHFGSRTQLERRRLPKEIKAGGRFVRPCQLRLSEGLDIPRADDTGDRRLMTDTVENVIDHLRDETPGVSHLMGYSVHNRTGNTSPGADWINLLTLGSDKNAGWSWCDGEHLDIYIMRAALKKRRFNDCHAEAA